jgi:hypothetical protein
MMHATVDDEASRKPKEEGNSAEMIVPMTFSWSEQSNLTQQCLARHDCAGFHGCNSPKDKVSVQVEALRSLLKMPHPLDELFVLRLA